MQAELYRELAEGDDRLEIPWASPQEPANRYYDLKSRPDLLAQLSEARTSPALARFLGRVNARETLFATAKCDTWQTEEFSRAERAHIPHARIKCASYVDLVFAHPELNLHPQHYEHLAKRLLPPLLSHPAQARVEFCLRRCHYAEVQAWGFYLTVFLYGYGRDSAEAEREWTAGLEALEKALLGISEILRTILPDREGTLPR